MTHMTPLRLTALLHYMNAVTPFVPQFMPEGDPDPRAALIAEGLLVRSDSGSGFDVTPRAERYLNNVLLVRP